MCRMIRICSVDCIVREIQNHSGEKKYGRWRNIERSLRVHFPELEYVGTEQQRTKALSRDASRLHQGIWLLQPSAAAGNASDLELHIYSKVCSDTDVNKDLLHAMLDFGFVPRSFSVATRAVPAYCLDFAAELLSIHPIQSLQEDVIGGLLPPRPGRQSARVFFQTLTFPKH